jgi:drug/metabolite transporter (DMT)-like permease
VKPNHLAVLLALGCAWGASFLFIKVLVDETSTLEIVEGRVLFGALAVGAVITYRGAVPRWPLTFWGLVVTWTAISVVVPFALIAWAEEHIESGTASVLNSMMPIFTATFAAMFLAEEQMSPGRAFGLVAGFLGVAVLTGGDLWNVTDNNVLGQLAVVAAASFYGMGSVYGRMLLRRHDPLALSGGQLVVATLLVLPALFVFRGTPDYGLSVEGWASLVALGVLGTGLGFIAYLYLVDHVGSVRSSLVTYVVPVVGLILGWAVLDESIGLNTLAGFALIVAGVAVVMRGQAPSSQRPRPPAPVPEAAVAE